MPKKKNESNSLEELLAQEAETMKNTVAAEAAKESMGSSDDILTINITERGITPEDSDDVKWNYIAGAMHRHMILTGIVSGIEDRDEYNPSCIIDYEGVRILIPGRELFFDSWPAGEKPGKDFSVKIGRLLGATVDFMLLGVSIKERAAIGSRRAAMLQLQEKFYKTERVKKGIRIACRVIGVGNNAITVEAFGVDTEVQASKLSWEWFGDVADLYSPGDLVIARVLAVSQDELTGGYTISLSVKDATENPDLPNLQRLVPGSNYFGIVTGVKNRTIFVRLQIGANAKTMLFRTREIPSKLDTVSFQVKSVDEEIGVAYGLITRIIRKNTRAR